MNKWPIYFLVQNNLYQDHQAVVHPLCQHDALDESTLVRLHDALDESTLVRLGLEQQWMTRLDLKKMQVSNQLDLNLVLTRNLNRFWLVRAYFF